MAELDTHCAQCAQTSRGWSDLWEMHCTVYTCHVIYPMFVEKASRYDVEHEGRTIRDGEMDPDGPDVLDFAFKS